MWRLILPGYCTVCGVHSSGALLQGHCVICALGWPDVRGPAGAAMVGGRLQTEWAAMGFRVPDGPTLRGRLYGLKYGGERHWGREAGRWVAEGNVWPFKGQDVVLVPVPLHWRRKWHRGYNQSAWIAKGMADVWDVPVWAKVLRRRRHAASLTGEGRAGRQRALRQTYAANKGIEGRSFVLVDDVLTSGATCRAAASVLEAAGGHWRGIAVWGLA